MISSFPASPPDVQLQPGRPPMIWAAAADDPQGWAAQHRDALRAVVTQGRCWSVASDCAT